MPKLSRAPVYLFAFLVATTLVAQVKVDHARSEWMQGYVKLENADKALAEDNHLAAVQLYREALLVFETVRRKYPQWNPSLLNFRVKYCQDKIDQIERKVQSEAEEMSREKLLRLIADQAQMLHENSVKMQQLQNSVNILSESLQRARAEAARSAATEADFDSISQARQDLESRCQLLQNKLSKAEEDLAALRKKSEDQTLLVKLRQDHRLQGEQLKEAQRQIEVLQGNARSLTQDLQRSQVENQRLLKLTRDYEQRLGAANNRVNELIEQVNTIHAQYSDLQLKSRQQDIEMATHKEQLQRAQSGQKELNEEVARLRDWREKFLASQTAQQQLRQQVSELQNRLQENLEKQRFESAQRELDNENSELHSQPAIGAEEQTAQQAAEEQAKSLQAELSRHKLDLQRSHEYALNLEKQVQQLQVAHTELAKINRQLKDKDELIGQRDLALREQSRKLADSNSELLVKSQALESTQVELQNVRRKLAEAEQVNVRLGSEFSRMQRRSGDHRQEVEELKEKVQQLDQEKQAQQENVNKLELELKTRGELSARLESSLAEAERRKNELEKELVAQGEKNRQIQASLTESINRSQAAAGMASNLVDLQQELLHKTDELTGLRKELADSLANVELLREQLKSQQQGAQKLQGESSTGNETLWLARMAELNRRLEQEENKRKALEIALIRKDSASREQRAAERSTESEPSTQAASKNEAAEPQKLYTERDILLNGFLRQALDAEKKQKIEAAQWNYQKVLELDPAHALALKRLGLIAANHGNDADTIKYLQLAFRYDPDDSDVLLALGFAMLKQRQVEWAFSYLGRALALQPANPGLASHFAAALVDLGWTQAAEQQFARCLKLQPNDPHAAFNLAVLCATAQPPRLKEAKKWYEIAVNNGAEKDPGLEAAFNMAQP